MTTIREALEGCELSDVLAAREELELTGRLTTSAGERLHLTDDDGREIDADSALAEIDAWIAAYTEDA